LPLNAGGHAWSANSMLLVEDGKSSYEDNLSLRTDHG